MVWGACLGSTSLLLSTGIVSVVQVELLCNDCQHSSRVRFHIVGQKCPAPGCGSYNTRRVTIIRIPADAPADAIPELPPPQQAAAPPADA
jgi:Zinc-ribbon